MKREFSNKKLLLYSIFLYLLLLILELALNVFSFINKYSEETVGSTFLSKINESFNLLKYDIVFYLSILILIYVVFALINYKYVKLAYQGLKQKKLFQHSLIKAYLFIAINVYFILSLYFFNCVSYPYSNITSFPALLINQGNYHILKIIAFLLFLIYFTGFFYLSFKYAKKIVRISTLIFFGLILTSHFHPIYHLKNIYFSLSTRDNNKGPNVIIIGLDSLNPKHTGYSGYMLDTTPNLDSVSEECIVFKNSYTPLARTFPSWYSILTGQYPATNGVRYNLIKRKYINPQSETLASILKNEKNYFTAYFTDETRFNNILKEDGFQYLRQPLMGVKDFILGHFHDFSLTNVFFNSPLGYKIFDFLDINRGVYHIYKNNYFTDELISFFNLLKTKKKFFLTVHFCAPHWPYVSSAPYPLLYDNAPNPLFNLYDGALRMADDQLGRLLKALKRKGLYDNSIIIILSDHGESPEGHGTDLKLSDQNHIFLSFKLPKKNTHLEVKELVRTIDIAPTILDLLDSNFEDYNFDGLSLKHLLNGSKDMWNFDNSIILETGFSVDVPGGIGISIQEMINEGIHLYEFDKKGIITVKEEFHKELINKKQRAIQTLKWKLILEPLIRRHRKGQAISLYDLTNDPECKYDVSETYPHIYNHLLKQLSQHYKGEMSEYEK